MWFIFQINTVSDILESFTFRDMFKYWHAVKLVMHFNNKAEIYKKPQTSSKVLSKQRMYITAPVCLKMHK